MCLVKYVKNKGGMCCVCRKIKDVVEELKAMVEKVTFWGMLIMVCTKRQTRAKGKPACGDKDKG
jgi:hypothetical protein